jgi:hypothetical protein
MSYCKIFICSIFLFGCDSVNDPITDLPEIQKVVINNGMSYTLIIPKTEYAITDSLSLKYQVFNKTDSVKVYWFVNQQQYGIEIADSKDSIVIYFPIVVQFAPSTFTIQPSAVKEFMTTVPFRNLHGNYIAKGNYRLSVFLLDNNSPKVSLQIIIK